MPKGKKIDVPTGTRFGRLAVVRELERNGRKRQFLCKCDCGASRAVNLRDLTEGQSQSCGCLRREKFIARNYRHGQSRSPLYAVWVSMRQRCENPMHQSYRLYGGRGIAVCNEWQAFESFYAWAVKSGYKKGLTIDRRDNDGGYGPDNCRWVLHQKQMENTSQSRKVTFRGKTLTLTSWARELGIKPSTMFGRLHKGWSEDEALAIPLGGKRQ